MATFGGLTRAVASRETTTRSATLVSRRGTAGAGRILSSSRILNTNTTMVRSTPSASAADLWTKAEVVCFDVDSTVCSSEGIDDLARYLGKGDEVAEFTAKAMTGSIPFEEALASRLEIIKPSRNDIALFLQREPPSLTPGIKELVETLQSNGRKVYLVSGGFRLMIEPVAEQLNIEKGNIFANTLFFSDETGEYENFDKKEFTSRAGGKARAAKHIKSMTGAKVLVMVGDGATDLEAKQDGGADMFVGFGGIVQRETVLKQADWAVYDFQDLTKGLR